MLAELPARVAYRAKYVREKIANCDNRKQRRVPEIFIDELYCNIHHVAGKMWLEEGARRFTKSRGVSGL